jgi:hypothetical protein
LDSRPAVVWPDALLLQLVATKADHGGLRLQQCTAPALQTLEVRMPLTPGGSGSWQKQESDKGVSQLGEMDYITRTYIN